MPSKFGGVATSKFGGQPIDSPEAITAEIQAGIPQAENDFLDKATGALPTIASALVAEPVAGLAGLASLPFKGAEAGDVVGTVRDAITIDPNTEAGRQGLMAIANNPAIKFLSDIDAKAKEVGGETGFDLAGPIGGAIGASLPTILESALGLKGVQTAAKTAKTASSAIDSATEAAVDAAKVIPEKAGELVSQGTAAVSNKLPGRRKAKELIESGQLGDARTAKFNLTDSGKIEVDPFAKESIKQGFDKGVVADIKSASAATRQKMRNMVNIMERGLNNSRFSALNRASDVVGDEANLSMQPSLLIIF